jgi:hypothetical protein
MTHVLGHHHRGSEQSAAATIRVVAEALGYEHPLVAPHCSQTWQLPARFIFTPHA